MTREKILYWFGYVFYVLVLILAQSLGWAHFFNVLEQVSEQYTPLMSVVGSLFFFYGSYLIHIAIKRMGLDGEDILYKWPRPLSFAMKRFLQEGTVFVLKCYMGSLFIIYMADIIHGNESAFFFFGGSLKLLYLIVSLVLFYVVHIFFHQLRFLFDKKAKEET